MLVILLIHERVCVSVGANSQYELRDVYLNADRIIDIRPGEEKTCICYDRAGKAEWINVAESVDEILAMVGPNLHFAKTIRPIVSEMIQNTF